MSNPALDYELSQLMTALVRHEGLRLKPYKCSMDKLTIGIGRNLEDVGLSEDEAYYLAANDCKRVRDALLKHTWFLKLNHPRRLVLMNMGFQLGIPKLLTFKKFLTALEKGDYRTASLEMLDSQWHKQTPARCEELAGVMASSF